MKSTTTSRHYSQGARADAAEATARRITDAFIARLMTQWYDEITLDRVAEDAGVTVQTVVRRFGGKEGLLKVAVDAMSKQINAQRGASSGDIVVLIDNLLGDYEQTGDAIVRLLALEDRHPVLSDVLNFGRREHRRWVIEAFAQSLDKQDAVAYENAIDTLVIATDVYVWKLLRRDMGHSLSATAATMTGMVRAMLADTRKRD